MLYLLGAEVRGQKMGRFSKPKRGFVSCVHEIGRLRAVVRFLFEKIGRQKLSVEWRPEGGVVVSCLRLRRLSFPFSLKATKSKRTWTVPSGPTLGSTSKPPQQRS